MIPDYVTRLRAEIERREQSKRYCDAAEGQRWFSELLRRQDNERCLNNASALTTLTRGGAHRS